MNTQSRMPQRIGGLGIVYSLLFTGALILSGSQPSADASSASVIKYYRSHRAAETAAVFVIAAAAIVFTFFLSSLRGTLGRSTDARQLTPIVTAGGAVYVGGLLFMGALTIALVDSAHYRMTSVAQTLNVLSSDRVGAGSGWTVDSDSRHWGRHASRLCATSLVGLVFARPRDTGGSRPTGRHSVPRHSAVDTRRGDRPTPLVASLPSHR